VRALAQAEEEAQREAINAKNALQDTDNRLRGYREQLVGLRGSQPVFLNICSARLAAG